MCVCIMLLGEEYSYCRHGLLLENQSDMLFVAANWLILFIYGPLWYWNKWDLMLRLCSSCRVSE